MRSITWIIAFTTLVSVSCSRPGMRLRDYSVVTDTLSDNSYYAIVPAGSSGNVLLVTDEVYDNLDGNKVSIYATAFGKGSDGKIVCFGSVRSQGTAYPLSVSGNKLVLGGHRYVLLGHFDGESGCFARDNWYVESFNEDLTSIYRVFSCADTTGRVVLYGSPEISVLDSLSMTAKVVDFKKFR